ATADRSPLGRAVSRILNEHRGSNLTALVVLTDGIDSDEGELRRAAEQAARLRVPLFLVGIGDSRSRPSLTLDVEAPEGVTVEEPIGLRVRLSLQAPKDLSV